MVSLHFNLVESTEINGQIYYSVFMLLFFVWDCVEVEKTQTIIFF